jgi:hypothetical protein
MSLLRLIEQHLRRTGTPATRFGREAVKDPRFVLDLRNGREPREDTAHRIRRHIAAIESRVNS